MSDHSEKQDISRRDFLTKSALASVVIAGVGALAGAGAFSKPAVSPGPSRKYKIGEPEEFPVGTAVKMEKENIFLFHDEKGFYSLTAVCTHLGCIVSQSENGFTCPCHGSEFSKDGAVKGGPAPRALPWLKMSLTPDGKLMVDADQEVAPGTKLEV
ncbi:MAG: hypothetical protein A2147_06245 [Chloroflexi bacterium RBG_16_57_8]|nr:MAG: hypothetical protein A2147_06245 [Chloroflexi bacterium RBG_16_57_8]